MSTDTACDCIPGEPGCAYKSMGANVAPSIDPASDVDLACFMTTDVVDADNEIVLPSGADFSRYEKNPVVMLNHSMGQPGSYYPLPVGRAVWWKKRPNGIMAGIRFARNSQMGQEIKSLFDESVLKTFSIGFRSLEASPLTREEAEKRPDWLKAYAAANGRILVHRKWLLVELSVVPIPCNPDALVVSYRSKGLALPAWIQATRGGSPMTDAAKSADTFRGHPVVDGEWDATAAEGRLRHWAGGENSMEWGKYGKAFLWHDTSKPEEFGSYKLPFCDVRNGGLVAVRRALSACLAVLNGGRGGVSIPADAKERLKGELSRFSEAKEKEDEKAMDDIETKAADEPVEDIDETDADDQYKAMCSEAKKCFGGMAHGKGASLHAHKGKMALHHVHGEDGPADDEVEKCYAGTPHMKAFTMGDSEPEGEGYESIAKCSKGCKCGSGDDDGSKALSEGSGTSGGYTVDPDGDDDEHEEGEPARDELRRGHSVEITGGGHKGFGKVVSVHKDGDFVPDVDDHVIGTEDEPAAKVHRHKRMGDGFVPTGHYTAHKCVHLKRCGDLKSPSKKSLPAKLNVVPKPDPAAKPAPPPAKKTLPPIEDVGLSVEEYRSRLMAEGVKAVKDANKRALERKMGIV